MLPAWIEWGLRRPHVVVVPVLMVLMFLCLALAPVRGWSPRSPQLAVYRGTPPSLPEKALPSLQRLPDLEFEPPDVGVLEPIPWTRQSARSRTRESRGSGGTVSYYEQSLPSTMNPLYARSMVDVRTHELVFDRLFYRSPITNEVTSRVVRDVEVDDRSVVVTLWDDILWHDGETLTADDVCFTIDTLLDPATATPLLDRYKDVLASCSVTGDGLSAVIGFTRPVFNPLDRLGLSVLPHHMFYGVDVTPDDEFSHHPIGTGPMRGSKGTRGVRFVEVPNAHQSARIQVMNLRPGGDSFVQVRTLVAKGVQGVITVPPALRHEIQASDDVALKSYDLRSWWYVALNTSSGPFQNQAIRQAIDLSVDRTELRLLTVGFDPDDPNPACEFISGPFVQSSPFYNRHIPTRDTPDRARAEQLMMEAGARKGEGLWELGGNPITLRIGMHAPLNAEARDILSQFGHQMQAASFNQRVTRVSSDDWVTRATSGGLVSEYDMLIGKWSFGHSENVSNIFHSRTNDGDGRLNIFNYSNPEVDALLARYDLAKTDTEAQDATHELHARLAEDLPYIFLWSLNTKSAWRNEVRGNTISPYFYFTNYEGWRYDG